MRRRKLGMGPVFRRQGGGLVFTAEDFEDGDVQVQSSGGGQNPPGGGQSAGQPTGSVQLPAAAPSPPARDPRFDFDIDLVDDRGNVVGAVDKSGRPRQAGDDSQQQQQQQQQNNLLDQVLDGEGVDPAIKGQKISDLIRAYQTATTLLARQPQPQGYPQGGQPQPQLPPQPTPVEFTDEDFGVTADPKKFGAKLNQVMEQFASAKLTPLQMQNLATQSVLVSMNARQTLPYYNLFAQEIESEVRGQPITVTANPLYWQSVHDRLVRENINRVVAHHNTTNRPKPEPGGAERGNGTGAPAGNGEPKRPQISMEEWRVINGTGVKPQEYVFYRDRY